jgi:hypothetical protein
MGHLGTVTRGEIVNERIVAFLGAQQDSGGHRRRSPKSRRPNAKRRRRPDRRSRAYSHSIVAGGFEETS